jgi:hypothetical protein
MEQVSIFPRGQYWWMSYFDPARGRRVTKTTGVRIDDPMGRRRVVELARERSATAKLLKPAMESSAWEHWAKAYLEDRYKGSPKTLKRALGALKLLQSFWHEAGILTPGMVRYEHAQAWVKWRTSRLRPRGTPISVNSALCDLRFFTILMREAVRRGFCPAVTIDRPGIKKVPVKEKPEITADELDIIRRKLVDRPVWMRDAFEVAMAQGCRLTETQVPLDQIDEERGTVSFRIKGGRRHVTALNPCLRDLVVRRRREGAKTLVTLPALPAKEWWQFFRDIGMPHLCFHCTRVTVISQLARRGVPIQIAMGFIGHADETVHKIYQRLGPRDYAPALAAISSLASDATAGSPGEPQSTPPPSRRSSSGRKTASPAAP